MTAKPSGYARVPMKDHDLDLQRNVVVRQSDNAAVPTVARAVSIALLLMLPAALSRAETGFNPPRHSAAQRAEAKHAYEDCLVRAASRLDDGRSDPGVIADAMRGLCIEQQFQMAEAIADGARQSYLILRSMDRYRADALDAVLLVRGAASAAGRSEGRPTPSPGRLVPPPSPYARD